MPLVWTPGHNPEIAFSELAEAYATAIHAGVKTLAERYSVEIEAWLKDNAPWTDRTGNARQSLYSEVTDIANQAVIIILGHGVDYGTFLELAHGGNYAVIGPALDYFIPRIWRDVRALVR